MQSGNTTGSGLAPAAHLRAASGGGATRRRPGAGRKQQRQDGGGRRRGERPAVVKPAGRTDQGEGDEDEDEDEEPARPVEAPKVPQAAPTNSYVTKTHTKYIKAAVVEAYKKQHAHDLPAGQDLATWAPKVVASGAVVREVVGMCQEKFPDKKAVFTEARVRKKYREKPKQARGGKGKGKGGGQGPEGGQRLVTNQAKVVRTEATAQRIAQRVAGEREAAEEHVTLLAEGREELHRVTSGARRRDLRRILNVDERMAVEDDESMMSTAYDELTALYSRVARRTDDVEGARGLARDTFALREKLVAAAPEQAWAQVHIRARQVCVSDADGIGQGMMVTLPISRRRVAGDENLQPGGKRGRVSQPEGVIAGRRVLERTSKQLVVVATSAQNALRQLPAISTPNSSNLFLQGPLEYKGNDVVPSLACNDSTLAEKLVAGVKKMVTEHIPAGPGPPTSSAPARTATHSSSTMLADITKQR